MSEMKNNSVAGAQEQTAELVVKRTAEQAAEIVLIIDFGGQYKELIARRVRECGVYSEIKPNNISAAEIRKLAPVGIIFTGGPDSVYKEGAPVCDPEILTLGIPVLGICYGMHLLCRLQGGRVVPCAKSEYGTGMAMLDGDSELFLGCAGAQKVLMSHNDRVAELPPGFAAIASTELCPVAAFENTAQHLYGVQFHLEVENTAHGTAMLHNFLYRICRAAGGYSMDNFLKEQIAAIRERVGRKKVLLGLSGGVDSAVCAALLEQAIHDQLTCIYVDHGFMRQGETEEICQTFGRRKLNFVCVNAGERFLQRMAGVADPERKRKIIGAEFAKVFEEESQKLGHLDFLAQGTIYPDVVESGTNSAVIKSHHNVGGLPQGLDFEGVIEPLRGLFKDEVRQLGLLLELPHSIVYRQPFPGPGLAIRIIGEVTADKLTVLRAADAIMRQEIKRSRCKPDQFFTVLTNTHSVGVMGDGRTYGYTLALRAVRTNDFMTCEFARLSYNLLARISSRITNEVQSINRVVYDVTSKPPATIEWE